MKSLPSPYNALIIGSTGGIGSALLDAVRRDPACAFAAGLSRSTSPALNLRDELSISSALKTLEPHAPFHLIIIATGALTLNGIGPEKRLNDLTADQLMASLAINAIGPALILKHLTHLLPRQERCLCGVLSARVGSIGDNKTGGWYSYRASKAALNMLIRSSAIELSRKFPHFVLSALHPGTVKTSLSSPYVTQHNQFEPATSAQHLLDVLDTLSAQDHGGFRAWDGQSIEW